MEKLSDDTDEFNDEEDDELFRVRCAIILGCSLFSAGSFSVDSDLDCGNENENGQTHMFKKKKRKEKKKQEAESRGKEYMARGFHYLLHLQPRVRCCFGNGDA